MREFRVKFQTGVEFFAARKEILILLKSLKKEVKVAFSRSCSG